MPSSGRWGTVLALTGIIVLFVTLLAGVITMGQSKDLSAGHWLVLLLGATIGYAGFLIRRRARTRTEPTPQ